MPRVAGVAAESGFVEVQGAHLEVRWVGPPPDVAPTLVFLHEGLGSAGQWRDLPDVLAERSGLGALVYSRAGYGRSSPVAGPRPTSFMHEEADAVLPELLASCAVRRPILFGHSDGASIALLYAGSERLPRPLGLILEAPHVFVEPVCLTSIGRLAAAHSSPTAEGARLRASFARHHGVEAVRTVESWTEVWLRPEFAAWNIERVLPRVECPALVVQGEDDEYGTELQLERLRAGVTGPVETHLLRACGHTPHWDRRADVLALAEAFLARVAG